MSALADDRAAAVRRGTVVPLRVPPPVAPADPAPVQASEPEIFEPETFETVFRRLLPRAIRVAHRILGDEMLAEDAAAEAFARAHATWRRVGALEYRDAWILRVTANVAVDLARKRQRLSSAAARLAVTAHETALSAHEPRDVDGTRAAVAEALMALPRRQREVMVLRYIDGFTDEQVASTLGVGAGTVKKNGFRARATLRRRLRREV